MGIEIKRNIAAGVTIMSQSRYIQEMLSCYQMTDSKVMSTQAEKGHELTSDMAPKNFEEIEEMRNKPLRNLVGSLMYATVCTRPDIAFSVNKVSQFANNPGRAHWKAAKRILKYKKGTTNWGLTFSSDCDVRITGYADADWGGDKDTRRLTAGYVFVCSNAAISWGCAKQRSVAL